MAREEECGPAYGARRVTGIARIQYRREFLLNKTDDPTAPALWYIFIERNGLTPQPTRYGWDSYEIARRYAEQDLNITVRR